MSRQIHRFIRKLTGENDFYREIKDRFNHLALEIYPKLVTYVERSENLLETALRLAAAGNVIDLGLNSHMDEAQVYETVEHALTTPLIGEWEEFSDAVTRAEDILYLADNAGEIFFDKLLITQLPREKITVAVRGFPVINDATIADARLAGLKPGQTVLEVGCGTGFFTMLAAQIVGKEGFVYAVDINPNAIKRVQEKVERAAIQNVRPFHANASNAGLADNSIDLAFVFGLLHISGRMDSLIFELHRILKPGGVLSYEKSRGSEEKLIEVVERGGFGYSGRQGRILLFSKEQTRKQR